MRNTTSIDINRPIDEVFHLLHNNVEQRSIIVVEDDIAGDQTEGVRSDRPRRCGDAH